MSFYAVISQNQTLLYLGEDLSGVALQMDKCPEAIVIKRTNAESLSQELQKFGVKTETKSIIQNLVSVLDECGINKETADKLNKTSEKAVQSLRTLSLKGLTSVGEGLTALGDLFRKAGST